MEEGIAILQRSRYAQRSTLVWIDVEFAEGDEQGIPDGKASSPISEWLVTVYLSCIVIESTKQVKLVRCQKLRHPLLDVDLLPLTHDFMAAAAEVVESECNSSGKEEKVVCA